MANGPSADDRTAKRAQMRRATLHLVLGVIALDAAVLAVYHFSGIEHSAVRTRMYFTGGWMIATAVVVGVLLRRVRQARTYSYRARRG